MCTGVQYIFCVFVNNFVICHGAWCISSTVSFKCTVFLLYSSSVALFLSHHVEITTNKTVYINPHCLEMDVSI